MKAAFRNPWWWWCRPCQLPDFQVDPFQLDPLQVPTGAPVFMLGPVCMAGPARPTDPIVVGPPQLTDPIVALIPWLPPLIPWLPPLIPWLPPLIPWLPCPAAIAAELTPSAPTAVS